MCILFFKVVESAVWEEVNPESTDLITSLDCAYKVW